METTAEIHARTGGRPLRRIVYSADEIATRVSEMGGEISAAYPADEELLVIGLLKGSFIFMADLVRRIRRPLAVDFLVAASYGAGTVSSGSVKLVYDPEAARTQESRAVRTAAQAAGATARAGRALGRVRSTGGIPGRLRPGPQRELPQPALHRQHLGNGRDGTRRRNDAGQR
jgi:hypothetical protein